MALQGISLVLPA